MKILIQSLNFSPEPTGIGKYSGEMAAWLVAQGHQVRVVCAPPYYPEWKVSAGYSAWRYRTEVWNGVRVVRCPLWVPGRPGGLQRVLHLLSFAFTSLPAMLAQILWRPDLVWVVAPAFACTPGALLTARLSAAPAWLHVQDYEVDAAFDMGFLKGRRLRQWVTAAESWLMRRFDVVSSISRRMLQRAADKGVAAEKIAFFPNWVDVSAVTPLDRPSEYRRELGLPDDAIVALFSGTLGAKQGLQLIPEAARLLAERCPQLHFVVCGNGVMKPRLEAESQGLSNVHFLPLQPKERLSELLGMADIQLLPQEAGVADLVMPSKLTAMLSSGRPVVSTALLNTEVGETVAQCGLLAPPSNAMAFANALEKLALDPDLRATLGRAGRLYAESHLAGHHVLARFMHKAQNLANGLGLKPEFVPKAGRS